LSIVDSLLIVDWRLAIESGNEPLAAVPNQQSKTTNQQPVSNQRSEITNVLPMLYRTSRFRST
jgi:hypothetical protein